MSDYGSDQNDCHTESTPCKNLQAVLDRATDGAEIYVTSDALSLDRSQADLAINTPTYFGYRVQYTGLACLVNSSISYKLSSIHSTNINVTCSG